MKFNGKARRVTEGRESYAECLDPDCPHAWTGASAILASGSHAIGSGHEVRQRYQAVYRIIPILAVQTKQALPVQKDIAPLPTAKNPSLTTVAAPKDHSKVTTMKRTARPIRKPTAARKKV